MVLVAKPAVARDLALLPPETPRPLRSLDEVAQWLTSRAERLTFSPIQEDLKQYIRCPDCGRVDKAV